MVARIIQASAFVGSSATTVARSASAASGSANSAVRAGTFFERKDVSGVELQRSGKGLAGGLEIFDRVNLHAAGAPHDRGGAAIIQHLVGQIA